MVQRRRITMKNDAHYMWVLKRLIKMCALKKVDDEMRCNDIWYDVQISWQQCIDWIDAWFECANKTKSIVSYWITNRSFSAIGWR